MITIGTPTGSPITATGIDLPPLGPYQASIEYTIKKNSGNVTRTYNPCGYTPIAQAEIHPAFGKYIARKMAIDIPLVVLATDYPKPGDFFTGPDGNAYNVLDCQTPSFFVQRVIGICPQISFPLEDTIQYKQASCAASSSTGARTVVHTSVGSPVAAAVQPMNADIGRMFGTLDFEDHFVVYLASDPSGTGYTIIQAGDLFVDQNSVTYEIQRAFERNRLDFLPAFDVVKKL